MENIQLASRQALPLNMALLLRDYPREAWPDHPNFARSVQNWMGAHQMFRQLGEVSRGETEKYLDGNSAADDFAGRLSVYGNLLVRNLHGHHSWEDRAFFPELAAADPRFEHGLDMLEADHHALDDVLDRFTNTTNRVIKLVQMDEAQARNEAGDVLKLATDIEGYLARHLADEEDLVVPIILHHKLRG